MGMYTSADIRLHYMCICTSTHMLIDLQIYLPMYPYTDILICLDTYWLMYLHYLYTCILVRIPMYLYIHIAVDIYTYILVYLFS